MLKQILSRLAALKRAESAPVTVAPWLVDREGVVYLPERKIVLRARA